MKSTSLQSNCIEDGIKIKQPAGSVPLKSTLLFVPPGSAEYKSSSSHLVEVLVVIPDFEISVPLPRSHFHKQITTKLQ